MFGRARVLVLLVVWMGARTDAAARPGGEKREDADGKGDAAAKTDAEAKNEAPDNPWARARRPSTGPARSIGGYSAGCLRGAARLPVQGKGFSAG